MAKLSVVPAVASDVKVQLLAGFFWHSHFGYEPEYWDFMFMHFEAGPKNYAASVVTKGYFSTAEGLIEQGDLAKDFGLSPEGFQAKEAILFSKYRRPLEPHFQVLDGPDPIINGLSIPIPPEYIIYHPADHLTCPVVEEIVREFNREYKVVPLLGRVIFKDAPEEEQFRKEVEAIKAAGGNKVTITPHALEQLVGSREMDRFENIDYGFIKEGQYYVRLKDGSEQQIGKPRLELIKP